MVNIVKRLRHRADVRKLHRRAQADPYPRSYVELCRLLLSLGMVVRAMDMAREGLERFPHSDDLRDVLRHTWRHTKAAEIEELRGRCQSSDDPRHCHDLIRCYLECEEYDEALAVAEEFSRRQPDLVDGWLLQGEVLIRRFYKDHVASDATRGIIHLKRVIDLDENCFDAHYRLTQVYHYIGAISKALFHLYKALDIEPEHEGARNLYDILINLPLEREEEAILLREVEEDGLAARGGGGAEIRSEKRAAILIDLNRLSLLNGVVRVAFVSNDVSIVAAEGKGNFVNDPDADPLCAIARGFRRSAGISAKRMGIGAFQSAVLTAGRTTLNFHAAGSTVVLVEANDPGRSDVIRAECANFVASCLRNAKEIVHA